MAVIDSNKNQKTGGITPIQIELPDFSTEQPRFEKKLIKIRVHLADGWTLIGEYTAGRLRTVSLDHSSHRGHKNG